jgi:hypothetical protein
MAIDNFSSVEDMWNCGGAKFLQISIMKKAEMLTIIHYYRYGTQSNENTSPPEIRMPDNFVLLLPFGSDA